MNIRLSYLLLCLTIAGCHVGPRIGGFEGEQGPQGVATTIELRSGFAEGGRLEGELLEVREKGLLLNVRETAQGGVITTRRVVFVPYTAMQDIQLDQLGLRVLPELDEEHPEDVSKREVRYQEQLRLLSRFPQGLSAPLLEKLLAAEGQTTVEVIGGD